MDKYLKKNQKRDEKKMISTRVRTHVIDAFQNAAEDASLNGYTLTLSSIVETALEDAIGEYTKARGTDYLRIEEEKLHKEWEIEQLREQEEEFRKHEEQQHHEMDLIAEEQDKNMEKSFNENWEKQRALQNKKDADALLNLSSKDLEAYKEKRKKEIAAKKKKMKITMDRIKKKFDKEKAEEKDNKAKQKTNKEDIK